MARNILILITLLFIAIQFVPVSYNESSKIPKGDFILTESPPAEIAILLKNSCYDCHSNRTNYPWYDRIAPVSWWVAAHVYEGKGELNFSRWTSYVGKRKQHKLKEIVEEVEKGKMPLDSYLIMHGDAKVSEAQLQQLKNWIETIKE